MPPSVAIIMRSKNEMPHLRAALEMLRVQTYRDFELFAVDSGSTDGSVNLLRKHCKTGHLTQIAPAHYAPGKVLNTAIARSGNPIIVLLNADAVPLSKTWLETLLAPILGNQADATFSRQVPRPDARFVVAYDYRRAYEMNPSFTFALHAIASIYLSRRQTDRAIETYREILRKNPSDKAALSHLRELEAKSRRQEAG